MSTRAPATSRFRRVLLTGLAVLGLVWAVSQTVGARSYSLDRVVVEARVDRDGSLWIDETRTYTFDGRYSWADFRLPLDRVGSVSEFSLSEGDRAFAPGTDEAPGAYQLETSDDELYVRWHYSAEDERRSFRLRYRISDAVTRHPDVAEFYFQFVGEINPQPIGGVEVNVALPEPAVFDEVRAWAHGPLHGQVDFLDSGCLSFSVSPLPAEQMWEARVTFPAGWLEGDGAPVSGNPALPRILDEEDTWASVANAQRIRAVAAAQEREESNRVAGQVGGALAGVGLLTVFFGYRTAGRAHPVNYPLTIDSTLPEESPALASYFYYTKQVQGAALGATLFDLARRGILTIEQDPEKKKWYESGPNFTIRLDKKARDRQRAELQPYESSLMKFLFEEVAPEGDALHSRQLRKAKGKMRRWFKKWKALVRRAAGDDPYYDAPSKRMAGLSSLVAGGIIVTGSRCRSWAEPAVS